MHTAFLDQDMIPLDDFGCFVTIMDGTLFACAMLQNGTLDIDTDGQINWAQVVAPDNRLFLDLVNQQFDTDFTLDQFPGR